MSDLSGERQTMSRDELIEQAARVLVSSDPVTEREKEQLLCYCGGEGDPPGHEDDCPYLRPESQMPVDLVVERVYSLIASRAVVIGQTARLLHARDPHAIFAQFQDEEPRYLDTACALGRAGLLRDAVSSGEPLIHSHITDELPNDHPLAWEQVHCADCRILVHAVNNECMTAWVETRNNNYCLTCFANAEGIIDG